MNHPEDARWQNLVAMGAPAFGAAEDAAPPYGFTTRVLAELRAERRQRELMERTGMRALFASGLVLLLVGAFALGLNVADRGEFDPGMNGILQAANVPLS